MITHEDITNKKFGKLTALSYIKGGNWQCICQCGTYCVRSITSLKTNKAYCGSIRCKIKTDIVGLRFGRLVVLNDFKLKKKSGKWNRSYVKVCCDCGNEKYVMTTGLLSGDIQSCGCYKIDMQEEKVRKPRRIAMGLDGNLQTTSANKLRREWFRRGGFKSKILKRDNYKCSLCLTTNIVGNTLQIHHIIPVHIDLDKWNDLLNLITVCKKCHYTLVHPEGNLQIVSEQYSKILEQIAQYNTVLEVSN